MGFSRAATVAAVALLVAARVHAECIAPPPPCDALKRSAVVVLAKVVEASGPWPARPGDRLPHQDLRLQILERFKGLPGNQTEITATIPFSSAETIFLTQDSIYLVYAERGRSGGRQTACTGTRPASADDADVRALRQCVKGSAR